MKKLLILITTCFFAIISIQAQSSEVEASTQLTKAEQFKTNNSFIKEELIYKDDIFSVKIKAKLFTDLKTGEQLAALEFSASTAVKVLSGGADAPLGYIDMDQIDDLLLALETILETHNNSSKKDNYSISYTSNGGIDVTFMTNFPGQTAPILLLRKKWHAIDDYGVLTAKYTESINIIPVSSLPKFISSIKEAQIIAQQSLNK